MLFHRPYAPKVPLAVETSTLHVIRSLDRSTQLRISIGLTVFARLTTESPYSTMWVHTVITAINVFKNSRFWNSLIRHCYKMSTQRLRNVAATTIIFTSPSRPIRYTLWRVWTTFTRSAITSPKVNRFGWSLGHSEYIVWSWPWQILGARHSEHTGRKKSPSGHHPTTLSSYIFATKAYMDNRKKMLSSNISSTCLSPPHVPTIWWTSTY